MWFPKFPYTNFSQINLDWILRQIRELSEWMNRYFKDIRQDLDKEINDRIEGDKALNARVDKEITDRTEADNALGKRIDKEITDRTEADTALGKRIDKEITDRTEADNNLQANIDAEKTAREEADRQLQANIDAEKTAREEADRQLTQDITQLRTDAILKDGSTTTTAAIPFQEGIKTGSISEVTQGSGLAIESELDMNNHTIHSLADGVADTDAVNKSQLDTVSESIHSIPSGGTPGQVLAKIDETDYNVTWVNQQGGGSGNVPAGGTTGQVLAKATDADYQTEWVNQPEGLPTGGTEGQVVTKTADGVEWADLPESNWTQVTSFTSAYYKLYKNGNMRVLVPINSYKGPFTIEYRNSAIENLGYSSFKKIATIGAFPEEDRPSYSTPYPLTHIINDRSGNFGIMFPYIDFSNAEINIKASTLVISNISAMGTFEFSLESIYLPTIIYKTI